MKAHPTVEILLGFAAILLAMTLLCASHADARCYVDPLTGQRVCPLKQTAAKAVRPVAVKANEVSVVVKRTVCHAKKRCRCRPKLLRRLFCR